MFDREGGGDGLHWGHVGLAGGNGVAGAAPKPDVSDIL